MRGKLAWRVLAVAFNLSQGGKERLTLVPLLQLLLVKVGRLLQLYELLVGKLGLPKRGAKGSTG